MDYTTLDFLFLGVLSVVHFGLLILFTPMNLNQCFYLILTRVFKILILTDLIIILILAAVEYYFFFHQGIMGANRTALNRAIKEGKYELAEKLITSQSNPENLNDGSMTHALSTGKGLYRARPRNLRIVRLLLEKGASPNFRSPNVLDLPSVSAFEVAINYYLTLLKYQDST